MESNSFLLIQFTRHSLRFWVLSQQPPFYIVTKCFSAQQKKNSSSFLHSHSYKQTNKHHFHVFVKKLVIFDLHLKKKNFHCNNDFDLSNKHNASVILLFVFSMKNNNKKLTKGCKNNMKSMFVSKVKKINAVVESFLLLTIRHNYYYYYYYRLKHHYSFAV